MRIFVALIVVGTVVGSSICDPNPCLNPENTDITYDADKTTCSPQNRQCFTTPCPQYDCLDCRAVRCRAPECAVELQVQSGCCITCPEPEPVICTMDSQTCPDGSFVFRDPENGCEFTPCLIVDPPPTSVCDNNPCADSSSSDFDENKQICVPDPKECFTTPCPQYKCVSICDPNPCINPQIKGFEWDKPLCVPSPKACFTEPCPQYECQALECMVMCAQPMCDIGYRLDSCCGPCTAVPIMCMDDVRICADGSTTLVRDPALNCEFNGKCAEDDKDPCENNPCTDSSRADYDSLRPICMASPNDCAECPQFTCTNMCETENPCLDPRTEGFDFNKPHCQYSPKECFTTPCPQFECQELDCSLVKCMQIECKPGTRRANCCGECSPVPNYCEADSKTCDDGTVLFRDPALNCTFSECEDMIMCAMDLLECKDGSFVSRDPANGCAFPKCEGDDDPCAGEVNPCQDSSRADYDALNTICVTDANSETNFRCTNICETVNPCIDPSTEGYDFDKPHCKPINVQCLVAPCPQFECEALDCSLVRCMQHECEEGTRKDTCCGPCRKVPEIMCAMDLQECKDGSFVSRDPANGCAFPKCADETDVCDPNPCENQNNPDIVYDATKSMCVPQKKACFTTPCPQYACIEPVFCTEELKLCDDGETSVARDPMNGCEFAPCPASPCRPNPCLDQSHDGYDANKPVCNIDANGQPICEELRCLAVLCPMYKCSGNQHLETAPDECCARCTDDEVCDMSIKTCDDGSTVGRDGKNHCEFAPCPGEGMVCEMDAKICENGISVGRDPYNNCEFPDCPQPNPCDSNPCGVQRPMCVVDWDKGTYECQELNCAVVDCMAVFECEAGFHVETVGCCPQCVADNASPCSPNPCTSEAPYCIPAPKQCITIPCWQFECTTNDAQKGSTASASAVKLTPGGVAGVTVGTIVGAALLVVGALFLCRAQFTHKKGTTPLNSKQGSPEPSLRDSQATAPGVDTGSVSVTVEGEPPSPQQAPVTQIVS